MPAREYGNPLSFATETVFIQNVPLFASPTCPNNHQDSRGLQANAVTFRNSVGQPKLFWRGTNEEDVLTWPALFREIELIAGVLQPRDSVWAVRRLEHLQRRFAR